MIKKVLRGTGRFLGLSGATSLTYGAYTLRNLPSDDDGSPYLNDRLLNDRKERDYEKGVYCHFQGTIGNDTNDATILRTRKVYVEKSFRIATDKDGRKLYIRRPDKVRREWAVNELPIYLWVDPEGKKPTERKDANSPSSSSSSQDAINNQSNSSLVRLSTGVGDVNQSEANNLNRLKVLIPMSIVARSGISEGYVPYENFPEEIFQSKALSETVASWQTDKESSESGQKFDNESETAEIVKARRDAYVEKMRSLMISNLPGYKEEDGTIDTTDWETKDGVVYTTRIYESQALTTLLPYYGRPIRLKCTGLIHSEVIKGKVVHTFSIPNEHFEMRKGRFEVVIPDDTINNDALRIMYGTFPIGLISIVSGVILFAVSALL